jgi:hypothetical protein
MKRSYIYTFMIAIGLILSACGSNSKPDGIGNGNIGGDNNISGKITTALQGITIDKNSGNMAANVKVTSNYAHTVVATLNNMNIALGGCMLQTGSLSVNPNAVTLDVNTPEKEVILSGKLTDPSCVPTSYKITGTNTLLENGETTVQAFATDMIAIDHELITINDSSLLTLNVSTKQLDINESGIEKSITINVLKGQVGIANKNVKIENLSSIVGSFASQSVLSDASGDAVFVYTAPTPIVDNNFTVKFCLEENTSMCDTAKINLTTSIITEPVEPIDNINYFITFVPNNGVNNLALGTRNNAIVSLIDKDTKEAIPNKRIKSITVNSKDLSVLKLTPEGGGTPAATISFGANKNTVPVLLTADKINSGLAIIEVIIEYENLNGVSKVRGQLFSVAVLSGKPTAFSINDDGVEYNYATKQFEHKFIVQATDASGNNVATTGFITVSAMASFAKDASGKEILYGRHSNGVRATLSPNNGKARLTLGGAAPFESENLKKNRAFVAVFGDVDTYEALGKWNIENIISGDMLDFSNEYQGEAHDDLGMAIGYNYRDKICTSAYEESVVVVDSADGTYQLDKTGKAIVLLKYDSYMIGKRSMILVNMTGLDPNTEKVLRSGEVHEQTLRFYKPLKGKTVSLEANETKAFRHYGVIETGTEDRYRLVNSVFGCEEEEGTDNIKVLSRSYNDPASCDQGGRAYIDYVVTTVSDKDGSFVLSNCTPSDEKTF